MGRKANNRIVCPICQKIGTIRYKDSKSSNLVVYHYDKKKYQKGEPSDYSCYLGRVSDELTTNVIKAWRDKEENKIRKKSKATYQSGKDYEVKKASPELDKKEEMIRELLCGFKFQRPKLDSEITQTDLILSDIFKEIAQFTNEFRESHPYLGRAKTIEMPFECRCKTKHLIEVIYHGLRPNLVHRIEAKNQIKSS